MHRRRFLKTALKATGYGLGAGLVGGAGLIAWVQPRRHRLPVSDGNEARPPRATVRRRVVVVGGGLAGLVAALALQDRNFDVTIVERAPELGGKLGGWTVRALGETFPVEHGFHGFFSQYYNLAEVLADAGAGDGLVDAPGYPVLYADRPPERFGQTTRFFPFNMLSVVRQSRSLRLADFRHDGDGLYDLMRYDGEATFARFDGVDFARFAHERGINRPMVETVLEPFGKTTLNRLSRLSAAEAIRFFHFYFMGNPAGLAFRMLGRDSLTSVIGPLRRRFEALGGRVRTGVGASRIERDARGITRVRLDPQPDARDVTIAVRGEELPERGYRAFPQADGSSIFVGRRGDRVVALDGRCTHMGCPVAFDADADRFRCPCHGGIFDGDGRPIAGPPVRPLDALAVSPGPQLQVSRIEGCDLADLTLECDYCVLACEVRGLRGLLERSDFLGEPELRRRVSSLGEADPYLILRLWLDRPTLPSRSPFYTTARFRYTDSLAIYSAFQEPYMSWARRTGGSVVEVHAYAIPPEALAPAPVMRAAMLRELTQMLPELDGARVLHEELQQQDNFTRLAPGDHALRPSTETPIANLLLAGDHVRLPAPAALMEAATISGRMAANAVLHREGVREVVISTVAPRGPLA
jgi:isorenieratene synthase